MHANIIRTNMVHACLDADSRPARQPAITRFPRFAVIACVAMVGASSVDAQAPIRDRSESVTPLAAARRSADAAHAALKAAETRVAEARERAKRADDALKAARAEDEAARAEAKAATAELERARKDDESARARLAKVLEAR